MRRLAADQPTIAADLWALYRVDVLDCHLPTAVVSALVRRLPNEPASMTRAETLGSEEWLHWSADSSLLANLQDVTSLAARAAARQKAALKDRERAYRPPEPRRPQSGVARTDDDGAMAALLGSL